MSMTWGSFIMIDVKVQALIDCSIKLNEIKKKKNISILRAQEWILLRCGEEFLNGLIVVQLLCLLYISNGANTHTGAWRTKKNGS